MAEQFEHRPVMESEVVDLLGPVPPGLIVDGTVGGGGHAGAILRARSDLRLLGIDRDPAAVAAAGAALAPFGDRARIVQGGFEGVADIVGSDRSEEVVGILFDLGVSSAQLDSRVRGFSYWADEAPLDMRMDSAQTLTAADVVNEYSEADLAALIARNGEERYARRIAARIVAARPLRNTGDLVEAIKAGIPAPARRRGGHPARRTFQAIRIEVNHELPNLAGRARRVGPPARARRPDARAGVPLARGPGGEAPLHRLVAHRGPGAGAEGAAAAIAHSAWCASSPAGRSARREREVEENPRAASARLRAIERLQ